MIDLRKIAVSIRKKRIARYIKKKNIAIDFDTTIISNNCTGGIMYNDLGLEFKSPTINLYFADGEDFVEYVKNLKDYTSYGKLFSSEIRETKKGFNNAPVAILKCKGHRDLEIHFLHYQSFQDADDKWNRRSKRINFNNVFLVVEAQADSFKKMIPELLNLPYKKIIFTDIDYDSQFVLNMPFYHKFGIGDSCPILKLTSIIGHRGYDSFNFVDIIFSKKQSFR